MKTNDVLLELEIRHKYTICYFGYDGWPQAVKFKLFELGYSKYAQEYSIVLVVKTSMCRSKDIKITGNTQFILWDGHIDPDCNIIIGEYFKDSSMGTQKMARTWPKYDPRYMLKARDSIKENPMIWNIGDVKDHEKLHDLCHILD